MREVLPAAVRCDMVLHRAFRPRHVRKDGIGGEVRHGVTSGVSCETSANNYVTPHLHREYSAYPSLSPLAVTNKYCGDLGRRRIHAKTAQTNPQILAREISFIIGILRGPLFRGPLMRSLYVLI